MTKEEFQQLWTSNYPGKLPVSHLFKDDFPGRWFRIHSLPDSKRFPGNEDEWEVLLSRQNEIITDLLGIGTSIFLVTGEYNRGDHRSVQIKDNLDVFKPYRFISLDNVELYEINPDEYEEHVIYRPAFSELVWKPYSHNNILREIASDNIRAFFVSFDKNVIFAPYDGGVDFVLKDIETVEKYKNKYYKWLSKRQDGL